jgi:hypothetical protein
MIDRRSKLLVIDASVARSSGGSETLEPTAKACRERLKTILDVRHRMMMSQPIREEWNKHQSNYARTWRRNMYARKLIEIVNVPEDETFRNKIRLKAANTKNMEAMIKDCHLIEAASIADRIVISRDDEVRDLFRSVAQDFKVLQGIAWINPVDPAADVVAWLAAGANLNDRPKLTPTTNEGDTGQ